MKMFNRLPPQRPRQTIIDATADAPSAFRFAAGEADACKAVLLFQPVGSAAPPEVIWSRRCNSAAEAEAVITGLENVGDGAAFFGRLLLLLGPEYLEDEVDLMISVERDRIDAERADALAVAAAHRRVSCYAPDKEGWFYLTLQRASASRPEWSIAFRGRAERERLRDWLRWQGHRYLAFLDHAAEHGAQALEKHLLAEMFETEKRVKKEGRGAGGTRPLRMWRGE